MRTHTWRPCDWQCWETPWCRWSALAGLRRNERGSIEGLVRFEGWVCGYIPRPLLPVHLQLFPVNPIFQNRPFIRCSVHLAVPSALGGRIEGKQTSRCYRLPLPLLLASITSSHSTIFPSAIHSNPVFRHLDFDMNDRRERFEKLKNLPFFRISSFLLEDVLLVLGSTWRDLKVDPMLKCELDWIFKIVILTIMKKCLKGCWSREKRKMAGLGDPRIRVHSKELYRCRAIFSSSSPITLFKVRINIHL